MSNKLRWSACGRGLSRISQKLVVVDRKKHWTYWKTQFGVFPAFPLVAVSTVTMPLIYRPFIWVNNGMTSSLFYSLVIIGLHSICDSGSGGPTHRKNAAMIYCHANRPPTTHHQSLSPNTAHLWWSSCDWWFWIWGHTRSPQRKRVKPFRLLKQLSHEWISFQPSRQ